ncbi:MAG: exodeoxyribonuclease VII large subunit [Microbacteriaceae bacterium]|nr:exodeoxyribonuclease VII large subunit [Microbacteriaceae bacterium]
MANASSPDEPWTISMVTTELKAYIGRLGQLWVIGEVVEWNERATGIFGKIKDSSVEAAMSINAWNSVKSSLPNNVTAGDKVIALVRVDFYAKTGQLNLNVLEMRHAGLGDVLAKLEELKRKLAAEGLFDASRKRPLPFLPQNIGLITGKDSDAERDVIRNAELRWPQVVFTREYTPVQGDQAAAAIIAALERLDADPTVDVIIIARGGGDFQNLLPFSDEGLVRAVAAATTPVVSAIGHEPDQPLLDLVADLRASTPTDAAKRVVPDVNEELVLVSDLRNRAFQAASNFVRMNLERLEQVRSRPVLAGSAWIIDQRAEELVRTVQRGFELASRALDDARVETQSLRSHVRALSPQSTLERGYAIAVTPSGIAVTPLVVTLAHGTLDATSNGTHEANSTRKVES